MIRVKYPQTANERRESTNPSGRMAGHASVITRVHRAVIANGPSQAEKIATGELCHEAMICEQDRKGHAVTGRYRRARAIANAGPKLKTSASASTHSVKVVRPERSLYQGWPARSALDTRHVWKHQDRPHHSIRSLLWLTLDRQWEQPTHVRQSRQPAEKETMLSLESDAWLAR